MRRPVKYILSIIIAVAILCSCGIVYSRASRVDAQRGILFDTTLFDNDLIKHYLAARESMPTYEDIRREDSLRRERERLEREVTIVCVGDMVLGVNYPDNAPMLPVHDGAHLFDDVKEYLVGADLALGNLECLLLDKGGEHRYVRDPKYAFFFRSPERYVNHFVAAGFDFLSIGNNHLRDFGEVGVVSTMRVLDEAGIAYAGLKDRAELAVIERDGVRYGLCAFAPFEEMCDIHDFDLVRENIRKLRQKYMCDLVIVTHHGGAEGASASRVTRQSEWFGGGPRGNVYDFSHLCIDSGADLVFGHGPHVVRGMEIYKGKIIAYSLGNFCTPYMMNIKGKCGYAPLLRVRLSVGGEFRGGEIVSATQTTRTGPKRDAERVVVKEIRTLSHLDFPESRLVIADDGTLSLKE
jgi:hypothetical protein